MAKGWYVVHTYSGYENKIERQIRLLMADGSLDEVVFDVKVPAEEVIEVKNGKKRVVSKKFLPGYILLEMDLPDREWKVACGHIKRIQGVTGFVGTMGGKKPSPISGDEARSILQKAGDIKTESFMKPKQDFTVGESIKIIEGPFESFTGNVEEVLADKGKLKVMVGIFGRATPVEVGFAQVEKI